MGLTLIVIKSKVPCLCLTWGIFWRTAVKILFELINFLYAYKHTITYTLFGDLKIKFGNKIIGKNIFGQLGPDKFVKHR